MLINNAGYFVFLDAGASVSQRGSCSQTEKLQPRFAEICTHDKSVTVICALC